MMYTCSICKYKSELSNDLQQHLLRHRKVDLISAVIKLPLNKMTSKPRHSRNVSCTITSQDVQNQDEEDKEIVVNCNNEEMNNAGPSDNTHSNVRRSCRLKGLMNRNDAEKEVGSLDDNYYIPDESTDWSDESEAEQPKRCKRIRSKRKYVKTETKKTNVEPMLLTPKVEKEPSSETDSCSGNALSEKSTVDRYFCNYCGSGYRTESILADHIRHFHLNYCSICEVNFYDIKRYKQHIQKHLIKVFLCAYCQTEFSERDLLSIHIDMHLQQAAVRDVLSLEEDYLTERSQMNILYNMFTAGFQYARQTNGVVGESQLETNFYCSFLKQTSGEVIDDVDKYMCRMCGLTVVGQSHYKDHMQIAHEITKHEVEHFLSI